MMRAPRRWGSSRWPSSPSSPRSTAPATAGTAHQVAAAKAATRGFTHTPAAKKAGYALLKDADGIACIAMKGMGAMGVHYANGALVDGKIQVKHPEALVYRFTRNGHLRLAALEYLVTRAGGGRTIPRVARSCSDTGSTSRPRGTASGCRRTSRSMRGCGSRTRPGSSRCSTRRCTAPRASDTTGRGHGGSTDRGTTVGRAGRQVVRRQRAGPSTSVADEVHEVKEGS